MRCDTPAASVLLIKLDWNAFVDVLQARKLLKEAQGKSVDKTSMHLP